MCLVECPILHICSEYNFSLLAMGLVLTAGALSVCCSQFLVTAFSRLPFLV